jgi:hypothetical protein
VLNSWFPAGGTILGVSGNFRSGAWMKEIGLLGVESLEVILSLGPSYLFSSCLSGSKQPVAHALATIMFCTSAWDQATMG